MKHLFRNDYSEIAHPIVMDAINNACNEQNIGYGLDKHSENAAKLIKNVFGCPNADVHFLVGGTQTNMTFISYVLRPYEGVIACNTGHINVHETGAIEGSGHKVLAYQNENGKITPQGIIDLVKYHCDEHMVKPGMVYVSDSTETGSIYSKEELCSLYNTCKEYGLYFYIDGARLASALMSEENNVKPSDLGNLCDAFYVGGTKCGLMFGEALVINNENLKKDFRYQIKNKGAMLAKGFIAGIQYEALFTNNLYFEIGKHENEMAHLIIEGFKKLGFDVMPSPTNQIFVTLSNDVANTLMDEFGCEQWTDLGNRKVIRFVTSFATKEEDVKELLDFVKKLN